MAKIIYGVAGEGFGHSSRSHLIGQRLLDAGHDVMFVGSKKSLVYLKQYFPERVREIFGLSFAYINGRIDKSETLKRNLLNLPEGNKQNDELFWSLKGKVNELHRIGDCASPRDMLQAIREGYEIGSEI